MHWFQQLRPTRTRVTPMKKLTFVFILLFSLAGTIMAQDTITTKEGKDIKAKVLEINSTEIRYLDFDNLEGPTYVINKSEILLIRYQNGKNEVFNNDAQPQENTYNPQQPIVFEGMEYRDYKNHYNHRYYYRQFGDPYNPTLAGIASFLIPGLGQGLCDEWGRGLAIFGGNVLGSLAYIGTVAGTMQGTYDVLYPNPSVLLIGASLLAAYDIWNIVDAVHVAKIKNMYHQDLQGRRQANINMSLTPCFTYINTPETTAPALGLSLNIGF